MNKLLLIDGHSILNRAFYGVPLFGNTKGVHTNAVFGFLNMMFKFIDDEQPTHFAVAFDVHQPTFRHEMFKEYKGTRKPMLPELRDGGNSNSSTGDFSYGIEGFLIENGKLTQPVSEMNVTGNLITLWNSLVATGNDPRLNSSWRIPSLVFEGVDFSGL